MLYIYIDIYCINYLPVSAANLQRLAMFNIIGLRFCNVKNKSNKMAGKKCKNIS